MVSAIDLDDATPVGPGRARDQAVRPRRRRLRERLSLGHLFMIASALLAFVLVVSLLQDRTVTSEYVVADAEILPGSPITPDLVRVVELPADSAVGDQLATLADITGAVSAGHRLAPGDPITLTALAPAATPSGLRAMSIPIDRVDAVGGDLAPGDRVDVLSVVSGEATYVAVDLEVLATQNTDTRPGALSSPSLTTYFVTVSITDQDALAVALAMDSGTVSVLRSTGAEPVDPDERRLSRPTSDAAPLTSPTIPRPNAGTGTGDGSNTDGSTTGDADADADAEESSTGG
ncbi:MAG: Flp pilus assembly protein CpaB [Actinomycetota bacterium]